MRGSFSPFLVIPVLSTESVLSVNSSLLPNIVSHRKPSIRDARSLIAILYWRSPTLMSNVWIAGLQHLRQVRGKAHNWRLSGDIASDSSKHSYSACETMIGIPAIRQFIYEVHI